MSDCGSFGVAVLAAPLALVVLLVAGVAYLALEGARLIGRGVLKAVEFAGQALPALVRAANSALTSAGALVAEGITWTGNQISQTGERLRSLATEAYRLQLQSLQHAVPPLEGRVGGVVTPEPRLQAASRLPGTAAGQVSLRAVAQPVTAPSGLSLLTAPTPPVPPEPSALQEAPEVLKGIARVRAAQAALQAEQPLHLVASSLFSSSLDKAAQLSAQAEAHLEMGELEQAVKLAEHAEGLYTTVSYDSYQHLRKAERLTMAAVVGNTLEDMGYELKVAQGSQGIAFVGRREHRTLTLISRPEGRLELDMAGFHGDQCQVETKALLEGLRRNGLELCEIDLKRHGRFEGGPLIRKAQRQGQSLEAALESMVAQLAEPGPVRRRSRLAGSDEQANRARAWMGLHQSARGGSKA